MRTNLKDKIQAIFISLSLLLLLPLQGCIEDDLSVCGIGVNFVFTKNVEEIDKFASNVDKINLFVFDSGGNFVTEYSEEGDRLHARMMTLNLIEGTYSLVAWGNLCEDYELNNTMKLNEAILSLKRTQDTITIHPKDLYHGGLYQIEVKTGFQSDQVFTIELTKNTNNIKVTTKGLPYSKSETERTTYDCSIISRNGDYKFDNSITGTDRLHYIPQSSINDDNEKESDFVIMRELNDNTTASSILITRKEPGLTPVNLIEEDLIKILIPASVTGDLDRDDEFEIELEIQETNGTTIIYINGWEYTIGGSIV